MAIGPVPVSESALRLVQRLSKDHDLVLRTFRMLIVDLCQQFGGGHPGLVSFKSIMHTNANTGAEVPSAWRPLASPSGDM